MTTRLQRNPGDESGPFSRLGRNEVNLPINASTGFVDMEHSTVVFKMRADDTAEVGNNQLRPFGLTVDPDMLVQRAQERTDRVGLISEKLFQNTVNGTMGSYTLSRREEEAGRNLGMRKGYNFAHSSQATGTWTNTLGDSLPAYQPRGAVTPFFQPSVPQTLGETRGESQPSQMLTPEIHIPLTKFSSLANSDNARNMMPFAALGDYNLKLEFDRRVRCTEYFQTYDWPCNDVTADASGNVESVRLTYQFEDEVDLRRLDLGIGILAKVSWTGGSGGDGEAEGTITQIAPATGGYFDITVNLTGLANGQTLTGVDIQYADAPSTPPEYEIVDVYLELHVLQLTPQQMEGAMKAINNLEINFKDYFVKPEQMAAGPIWEQTIQVPRGSRGVAVLTPLNITGPGDSLNLYAGWDNAERYRFQTTNYRGVLEATTSRDVEIYDSAGRFPTTSDILDVWNNRGLHNIRVREFFSNIGLVAKKYDQYTPVTAAQPATLLRNNVRGFFPQMLTPSAEGNDMNVVIYSDGTKDMSQKTCLFVFYRDRLIKIMDGMAKLSQ